MTLHPPPPTPHLEDFLTGILVIQHFATPCVQPLASRPEAFIRMWNVGKAGCTCQDVVVPPQVLGGGVYDQVRPKLDCSLVDGGGKRAVYAHYGPPRVAEPGDATAGSHPLVSTAPPVPET